MGFSSALPRNLLGGIHRSAKSGNILATFEYFVSSIHLLAPKCFFKTRYPLLVYTFSLFYFQP